LAKLQIFPDSDNLTRAAADLFIQTAEEAIASRGYFTAALSGGSTPLNLYKLLAAEPFSERVEWENVHLFWGDERCVPPDHPDSNYFQAKNHLLDNIPIPAQNVYRIQAEFTPEQAARIYEETLLQFFAAHSTGDQTIEISFDLVLLGMGDDGHTASLFPGTTAVFEKSRWVTCVFVEKLGTWRVSLTPPVINRSRKVTFLVSGVGKSLTLQKVLYGTYQPDYLPAQVIQPHHGEAIWLVDEAAASHF
jgi:6-phosphogluconolactonase